MQSRAAIARNILGPGATALQEDLGYKRTEIHVPPGHSLAQTVENLLQGLAQASPDGGRGLHRKPSVQGSLQRDYSVPTMVDEVVLYSEPEDDDARPGLGSVQPRGRAEVMQQWLRPDSIQARCRSERREERRSEAPRQKPLALRGAAQAPEAAADLDWGSLSDNSRQAIKQWVAGQLGGRHCMLVLEQGCAETLLLPSASETLATSDLRGGAVLNVLSGLFAEGGLLNPSSGSGLFQAVFSKHPLQVLEEALEQCLREIGDPRVDRVSDLSPDQVNLALKQMSMKAQFASCTTPGADAAAVSASSDECTKVQVWTELARLHVEGWPSPAAGPVPAPATSKERPAAAPRPNSEKVFGDGGVLKELGKEEVELEAESQQMSLETLRAQNRLIEEYVMRLVRQRDELKQVTKMAEERDSYHILGLHGPSCSEDEVKKAYRNLARKEHPDKAGIGNKRRFQAIQQAYSSILKQRQLGGAATVAAEEENPPPEEVFGPSAILDESYRYAQEARASAECVARCGHRALRSWDEGAEGHGKRRVLRSLRDLTRQSASELRGAASQLRALSHASAALAKCAEALLSDCADLAETLNSAMALRDRCAMAEDAGRACGGSAELLDRISDATEATLRKVEKASPESSQEARGRSEEATNLLRLGARLLAESLARTAAVGRRTADEAISAALKALDLHRGMIMLDMEARKERERLSRRQRFDEDDGPVAAGDVDRPAKEPGATGSTAQSTKKSEEQSRTPKSRPTTPQVSQTPRDQLKSAAKRVKDRHVTLRVKNLRFMASLNEEALRTQGRLWALLQRSEGALLPEISVMQKNVLFDLVAQLLDFALSEAGRLSTASTPPARVLERALSFALALEHGKEIAVPVDSRTQALKLASLIDTQLLCQVVTGPFRRRLLALARRRAEGYSGGRNTSLKAWEDAANACCERIASCIQQAVLAPGAPEAPAEAPEAH